MIKEVATRSKVVDYIHTVSLGNALRMKIYALVKRLCCYCNSCLLSLAYLIHVHVHYQRLSVARGKTVTDDLEGSEDCFSDGPWIEMLKDLDMNGRKCIILLLFCFSYNEVCATCWSATGQLQTPNSQNIPTPLNQFSTCLILCTVGMSCLLQCCYTHTVSFYHSW